jgi:hypothetical protein
VQPPAVCRTGLPQGGCLLRVSKQHSLCILQLEMVFDTKFV